jgi:predicted DNA-binding transcriptional regulator YafY
MAWHLYQWGNTVEVIEPPELREMVVAWQNDSIGVMP